MGRRRALAMILLLGSICAGTKIGIMVNAIASNDLGLVNVGHRKAVKAYFKMRSGLACCRIAATAEKLVMIKRRARVMALKRPFDRSAFATSLPDDLVIGHHRNQGSNMEG
jgi:hypothetical protein